jgi:CRISPR-associated endonuclease Cas1
MAIIEDLVVSEYGAFVGLHGQRLRVTVKNEAVIEAPLLHLRSVQIHTRSASLSAAALSACCEAGIPVHFIDSFAGNYATVLSPHLTTVVATRRQQIEAVNNQVGVSVAQQLGVGKIRSQVANLRYFARRQSDDIRHELHQLSADLLAYSDRLEQMQAQTVEEVRAGSWALRAVATFTGRLFAP